MWYGKRMTEQQNLDQAARANIRAELVRKNMTQAMLVDELGTNPSWLTRRMRPNNPAPFTLSELEEIAHVLGTTTENLIRR